MSLQLTLDSGVPRETAAVAQAAFPRGHAYLKLRDALGPIYADRQCADLFARVGQPAACPWRLALITLLQFSENLSDRRAADAVRARIDWKYLLGLDLTDPGFDASVLSEFRSRLVAGGAEALLFDTLLTLCRERGLLAKRGRQRTDATHVLGAVRSLNRLGCAIETLRAALNALAIVAPDWLRAYTDPSWIERYGRPIDDFHILQGEAARRACAEAIGDDGHRLLAAVDAKAAPGWLRDVPAVVVLRWGWLQNFHVAEPPAGGLEGYGRIRWRTEAEDPPGLLLSGLRFLVSEARGLDLLSLLQPEQELILRQALGAAAKPVALHGQDDLAQPLVLGTLLGKQRLERLGIVGRRRSRRGHEAD